MMVRSKLQVQVLGLYKQCMRAAESKPGFKVNVQSDFRRNAQIPRTDTIRIEQVMRNGYRKLDMMKDPHVSGMGNFVDDKKKK
jgi:succinate dehydrogenase assembly factor 1